MTLIKTSETQILFKPSGETPSYRDDTHTHTRKQNTPPLTPLHLYARWPQLKQFPERGAPYIVDFLLFGRGLEGTDEL
jgi:hypothetical protein